jgi:hypothetical protein
MQRRLCAMWVLLHIFTCMNQHQQQQQLLKKRCYCQRPPAPADSRRQILHAFMHESACHHIQQNITVTHQGSCTCACLLMCMHLLICFLRCMCWLQSPGSVSAGGAPASAVGGILHGEQQQQHWYDISHHTVLCSQFQAMPRWCARVV